MRKRSALLAISSAAFVSLIVLVNINADNKALIQSKSSLAQRLWEKSAHADKTAETFNHWNEEGSVPTDCAKCHSTPGFKDYIAADGSRFNIVDAPASLGTTVECEACHADPERGVVHNRTNVIFPSGTEVTGLGPEAMCMECHQGRASTKSVDSAIAKAGLESDDTPSSSLKFINIHYYASAASQFGKVAMGGYQYPGKSYDARFAHIPGYNACNTCHNPHSLEVELDACLTCHIGIRDPKDIRFYGSFVDYDGDGNIEEGVYDEIATLKEILYGAIQTYANQVIGKPIAYDEISYPYFFNDKNGNGLVDSDEDDEANGYKSFSPRLLRAAYNFQAAKKDPNAFAHGGKYIIELLYDSIEDLNTSINNPALSSAISQPGASQTLQAVQKTQVRRDRNESVSGDRIIDENRFEFSEARNFSLSEEAAGRLTRTDEGHFDGSAEAWRHWDEDDAVPTSCAKCHSGEGLPYLLENGKIDKSMPVANGMLCVTCHTSPPLLRQAGPVKFPSGALKDLGDSSNLCLNCHQGRASKKSIDGAIAGGPGPYGFINIHYYAAAASFFGSEVQGGYEFAGKSYAGRNLFPNHNGLFDTCSKCHMSTVSFNRKYDDSDALFHNTEPSKKDCVLCHGQDVSQPHPGADPGQFEFEGIRPANIPDLDGDRNTRESLKDELRGLEEALYAQLQAYGRSIGKPVVYHELAYPYFFNDTNGNGVGDPDELTSSNGYQFDAPQLCAAYNFQMSKKEPCGYIHNPRYIAQLLVDSIGQLGGNVKLYAWR